MQPLSSVIFGVPLDLDLWVLAEYFVSKLHSILVPLKVSYRSFICVNSTVSCCQSKTQSYEFHVH